MREHPVSDHKENVPARAENMRGTIDERARSQSRSRRPRSSGDLIPTLLEDYAWDPTQAEVSLSALFDHAREDANEAINWYLRKKRPKKVVAMLCRIAALAMGGVAALLPLIAQIGERDGGSVIAVLENVGALEPVSITIALALAAGALVVDRVWGASSGWLRFIATELKLRDHLEAFELDWQRERARWQGQPPTHAQVDAMFDKLTVFTAQVNAILQEETRVWMEEFRSSLRELEQALKTRHEAARTEAAQAREAMRAKAEADALASIPAAANVKVTNASELDDSSWALRIDDGELRPVRGDNAAVTGISPGIRTFVATGRINGRTVSAELAVELRPGALAAIELKLS